MSRIRDFQNSRRSRRRVDTGVNTADDSAAPDVELNESLTQAKQPSTAAEPESATEGIGAQADAPSDGVAAEPRNSHVRLALMTGVAAIVALAALTGWLGLQEYQSHQVDQQRQLFLQVGRQGALNLTTIDWQEADADVKRILDSATGIFYDDFRNRSAPFIDVVKQAKSKSVGTVTEAGLESESDSAAQVLVAVSVKTSNAGAAEQESRAWRMRISVQKVGTDTKVSNVEFVP